MNKNDFYEWVKSAKGDLCDCDNCLKRKDYHKAIYFLQQALEKSAKASMMATSFSVERQPQKVKILKELHLPVYGPINFGHDWRKVFISQVKKILSNPTLKPFIKSFEDRGLKNIEDTIVRAQNVEDVKKPTESQITQIIKSSESLLSASKSTRIRLQIDQGLSEYRPYLNHIAKQAGSVINVNEITHLAKSYFNITMAIVALMLLSILLNPFEQNRYPGCEERDKPLIPHLHQLKTILNSCIGILETERSFLLN